MIFQGVFYIDAESKEELIEKLNIFSSVSGFDNYGSLPDRISDLDKDEPDDVGFFYFISNAFFESKKLALEAIKKMENIKWFWSHDYDLFFQDNDYDVGGQLVSKGKLIASTE